MLQFDGARLDSLQKQGLIAALQDIQAPVFLFGSRTDKNKRGGDVDIMILSDILFDQHFEQSIKIAVKFHTICDEKIDVVIFPAYEHFTPLQKDFYNHISKQKLK